MYFKKKQKQKQKQKNRYQWFMPVIIATQEAEIRRIAVGSQQLEEQFKRPHLENTQHRTGLAK
jgi:hypothetical protein